MNIYRIIFTVAATIAGLLSLTHYLVFTGNPDAQFYFAGSYFILFIIFTTATLTIPNTTQP